MRTLAVLAAVLVGYFGVSLAADTPKSFVNSLGMKMVCIKPGTFQMGSSDGEWDERAVHQVTISRPFFMAGSDSRGRCVRRGHRDPTAVAGRM